MRKSSVMPIQDKTGILSRLHKHSVIVDGHWIWADSYQGRTYPQLRVNYIVYSVPRLSLYIFKDKDLEDTSWHALHKIECSKPNCWNPDHLYAGTHDDNMKDKLIAAGTVNNFNCGHPRTKENSYHRTSGRRQWISCKMCGRKNTKAWRETKRA